MTRASQGTSPPKLRNGVMRRGSTWSYVIRVTDNSGVSKPRWVGGFPTEAAAKRARDEARIAASRNEFVDRSTLSVEDYLSQWLQAHALEVKPRTRAGYAHLIKNYVTPRIASKGLLSIASSWTPGAGTGSRCRPEPWSTSMLCCARRSQMPCATTRCSPAILPSGPSALGRSRPQLVLCGPRRACPRYSRRPAGTGCTPTSGSRPTPVPAAAS